MTIYAISLTIEANFLLDFIMRLLYLIDTKNIIK